MAKEDARKESLTTIQQTEKLSHGKGETESTLDSGLDGRTISLDS